MQWICRTPNRQIHTQKHARLAPMIGTTPRAAATIFNSTVFSQLISVSQRGLKILKVTLTTPLQFCEEHISTVSRRLREESQRATEETFSSS